MNKKFVLGILAHVDAGKTTLSESLLYHCGQIRALGRVDRGDSFLDNFALERERGITIFSKQALLELQDLTIFLLDTPGHVDFSAEMERTLQVLDYAVLVISAMDGIQGHTLTLWRLLERYQIPVFLFINKMDQPGTDHDALLAELKKNFGEGCVDFQAPEEVRTEDISVLNDQLLEQYLETGSLPEQEIPQLIRSRTLFPCYFGSALKDFGVTDLLGGLCRDCTQPEYSRNFGARVFKISRDPQGNRLTWLKITGGALKVRSVLTGQKQAALDEENWEEKVNQIRIYSGAKYSSIPEASAGTVCTVTGLTYTYPGQGLGTEPDTSLPLLEPVLGYEIRLPEGCDPHQTLIKLKQLEEEEPLLRISWEEKTEEIHAQLMGEVQTEILRQLIWDRFQIPVAFGEGKIVYKETIAAPVEGIGHFEPLRHYAEVHLLLEPGEAGSGLHFYTACSEDVLSRNWQRLILTHLEEREHPGVLTGSPITDMQITLITGRAHIKHTEGGDFRQATYRAVRQGLRKAKSILLEPFYDFQLEVPANLLGRAMNDLQLRNASFQSPQISEDTATLTGTAPVSSLQNYQREVTAYSHGKGRLFCSLGGYRPCANQEEVVAASGYDPEADIDNPTGSVFCSQGAGIQIPWDQVDAYAHMELLSGPVPEEESVAPSPGSSSGHLSSVRSSGYPGSYAEDQELMEIFERTFGPVQKKSPVSSVRKTVVAPSDNHRPVSKPQKKKDSYLLVDGYNIIFAWPELQDLSKISLNAARNRLMDILSNYQGYQGGTLILVFDAYKQEGHPEEILKYHNIYVVYTREAETADQFIEKTVHRIGRQNQVVVATSDGLEQIIIMGQGAVRLSAAGLAEEIETAGSEMRQRMNADKSRPESKNLLIHNVPEEMQNYLKKARLEKKDL